MAEARAFTQVLNRSYHPTICSTTPPPHHLPRRNVYRRICGGQPVRSPSTLQLARVADMNGAYPWFMDREQEFNFVYEHGVLRPEGPVDLPEGARGVARVREATSKSDGPSRRHAALGRVRARAVGVELPDTALSTDALYDEPQKKPNGK